MRISKEKFGITKDGKTVNLYTLRNKNGVEVRLINYGCIVKSIKIPNRRGILTDVVLGYDTLSQYENDDVFMGAVVGRYANRIGKGVFELNSVNYSLSCNDGVNHLHGGEKGFHKRVFKAEVKEDNVVFSRMSADGEEGYPGNLIVKVRYSLTEENKLKINYFAKSDKDTICNLTNHSYFNLAGRGCVLCHKLKLYAEQFLENDKDGLPTGKICEVKSTPMDFTKEKSIGQDIDADFEQLTLFGGYDHSFVLGSDKKLKKCSILSSEKSGIIMKVYTTKPGLQVYTANSLTQRKGKNGEIYKPRYAVCLETQMHPNSMEYPYFPSPILRYGEEYNEETVYEFQTV